MLAACAPWVAGCEGEPPQVEVINAIPTREVTTRDGRLVAPLPADLFATPFDRSIFGTSADGSFRVFVERLPEQKLPAVLGGLKDELIGLGWEPSEEKHYAAAVSIDMARGPKQARQLRSTWVIELGPDVLVCEAIANAISPSAAVSSTTGDSAPLPSATAIHDLQSARLGQPLRTLCESLRVTK